ncbi:MAG TPA: iron ABC transporter permease [Clostridiales bacterium]|nr:iron ABC transporter permease [Clostridiales bacterium]
MKKRLILTAALFILGILSIVIGVKDFSLAGVLGGNNNDLHILLVSRLPRLLSIIITGAGLSISGQIMQTITSNRFVSPSTAGTIEWCKFGILISIILAGGQSKILKILLAFVIAFLGNLLFVYIVQRIKYKNTVLVPLVGMMLGSVVSSLTMFLAYRYDLIQNISSWLQGSFSLIIKGNFELLYLGFPLVILAYMYAGKFTVAGMGESFATNLGVSYKKIINIGLLIVSLLTTTIVVTVGSIAFVGLIIPNLVSMYRGDNLKYTLVDTAILGSLFLLACDIIGRIIIYPYEVSISVVVSILGSIIFLFIIFSKKGKA